ncbi:MAG: hypothetical protein V8R91_11530 [Butyricimonas faecihominis]
MYTGEEVVMNRWRSGGEGKLLRRRFAGEGQHGAVCSMSKVMAGR